MTVETAAPEVSTALTPITQAQRMLAEAKTLPELMAIRDYATGAKAWAKARGLGVESENKAAEVIIRAERGIGTFLIEAGEDGVLATQADNQLVRASDKLHYDDLGLTRQRAAEYRRVAQLPEDVFGQMVFSAREGGERLAKHNFYRSLSEKPLGSIGRPTPETNDDPDFARFRAGAFGLLGWQVSEDGAGGPTKNGLTALPADQLAEFALIAQALLVAYREARAARA